MKRRRYPEYKDSGIEWLGEIPEHWEVKRLKHVIQCLDGRRIPLNAEQRTEMRGKYPYWGANGIVDYLNNWLFDEGLILLGEDGAPFFETSKDVAFWVTDKIWVNNHIHVLRPLRGIEARYFVHALNITDYGSFIDGTTRDKLTQDKMNSIPVLFPPTNEQHTIATFLDRETARIDGLIAKKQRQIELLQEKRIALIHEAIQETATRNLRVGRIANQVKRPIVRMDSDIYVPIGMYNWGRGIFHKEPTIGADLGDSDFFWIESDDLILSGQFAWEGAVALAGEEDVGCVATHRYPILRGKPDLMDTAYLFAFLTTKAGDFLLNEHSRGAAGRNRPLNAGTLLKEVIPVPPMAAQIRVSKHIYFEREFRKIVAGGISLLREYRTALISAAVTGKIDVREEVA